jgi:hypothetical protein
MVDKVDSSIGLSYRPANLRSLAEARMTTLSRNQLFPPTSETMNLATGFIFIEKCTITKFSRN